MQSIQNPWVFTPDEALTATGGSPDGLVAESVRQRLMDFGQNVLITRDAEQWYMLFLQQFANPLVYMLIGAAGIKAYFKGAADAAVIGAVLLFMAIIGFAQEMKARKAMAALLDLSAPKAKVRRDGKTVLMDAAGVVPGDILVLKPATGLPPMRDCWKSPTSRSTSPPSRANPCRWRKSLTP